MRWFLLASALLFGSALPAAAQHAGHHNPGGPTAGPAGGMSPYAGQENRDIKSLSDEDITELRRGGGWGLAKAAELNGFPGPAHILQLKEKLGLTADQTAAVEKLFAKMRDDAVLEGERLIGLERDLEARFRARDVDEAALKKSLAEIENSRQALRYIHLAAHLSTPAILDQRQMRLYAVARGYEKDACADVPAGHDPVMWKKHQGCE